MLIGLSPMKLFITLVSLVGLTLMLASCATQSLDDYAQNRPAFTPEEFFSGDLSAQGVVKNRSGKVIRYFSASIKAHWQNGQGTLEEKFLFNDGEVQTRVWSLVPSSISGKSKTYVARAGDVIGDGKAEVAGNAMHLNYQLQISYNDKPLILNVDDWMWQVDANTIINESKLSKWGFTLGSIQLAISRQAWLPPQP